MTHDLHDTVHQPPAAAGRAMPRWPLFLIGAPAAVAVWSGWVGLGGLCGFGPIHPLPGIWDSFQLNTAITLPVGIEAYGSYALGAWLRSAPGTTARSFGKTSAIGALALGMLGQAVYHILAAVHATRAPWPVVVFVSCLPVVSLGFGAALAHLLSDPAAGSAWKLLPAGTRAPASPVPGGTLPGGVAPAANGAPGRVAAPGGGAVSGTGPLTVPVSRPAAGARAHPQPQSRAGSPRPADSGPAPDLLKEFADELAGGQPPSIRVIRRRLGVGQSRAQRIQATLAAYLTGGPALPSQGAPVTQSVPAAGVPALAGTPQ